MSSLHDRIISISKKFNLSHVGSCLTAVDIIQRIYQEKKENEPFILSCGHAGLALYVVLEEEYGFDAEKLFLKHGTHPNRDIEHKIYCSTGSLGHGLPIALGMAMADRSKNVYCLISDGEATEGTIWETANVIGKYDITNLRIFLNYNGWAAYDQVSEFFIKKVELLFLGCLTVVKTKVEDFGLKGQSAHYMKL